MSLNPPLVPAAETEIVYFELLLNRIKLNSFLSSTCWVPGTVRCGDRKVHKARSPFLINVQCLKEKGIEKQGVCDHVRSPG